MEHCAMEGQQGKMAEIQKGGLLQRVIGDQLKHG